MLLGKETVTRRGFFGGRGGGRGEGGLGGCRQPRPFPLTVSLSAARLSLNFTPVHPFHPPTPTDPSLTPPRHQSDLRWVQLMLCMYNVPTARIHCEYLYVRVGRLILKKQP